MLNSLIEEHFPTTTDVRHSKDKPWVTKGFKILVQDCQKALHEGNTHHSTSPKSTRSTKATQGSGGRQSRQPSKSHLCDLAEQLCDGDTLALANNINMVFKEVSADLQPLLPTAAPADHYVPDECIASVTDCEQKLSKLFVYKAMGPDNIPNWILKDFYYILAAPISAI